MSTIEQDLAEVKQAKLAQQRARMAKAREVSMANRAARKAAKGVDVASPPSGQPIDDDPVAVQSAHSPQRQPQRSTGGVETVGRNGEVLSRRRTLAGDIFDIPKELIPKGWEYQWCAVSVVGNTEILLDQNLMFAENGWRAVPATRYPGKFMPVGHAGSIIRGGQMLMERPAALCDEARAEDLKAAKQLISDRNESLKLSGMRKNLGEGFEMSGKYRGTGGNIRMSIDPALDAPSPEHKLAEPGE